MTLALSLLAGSAHRALAEAVAGKLEVPLLTAEVEHFPDGEQDVQLTSSVRGADLFVLQPTGPPVDTHLIELLFLCDAAKRAGAERVTAVVPYFGYARQDRRARGREALGARVVADVIAAAGADRVVSVDVHSPAMEGFFAIPFEHLTAVPLLVAELQRLQPGGDAVVVAPDLGAVKLAEAVAKELELPVAVVRKSRLSGSEVAAKGVTGEVRGRVPIVVDDMISTGATIRAAAEAVTRADARPRVIVAATHGLFVGGATAVLGGDWLEHIIVTDTVPQSPDSPLPLDVVSVAPVLAEAISRLYSRESLQDLIRHE